MAQKLNKAGKMQEYVPAGNGDASGEYGYNNDTETFKKGENKHFRHFGKKQDETPQEAKPVEQEEPKQKENKNIAERTKSNFEKHLQNKSDENIKTLHKVVDETNEKGQEILENFLNDNEKLKIYFGKTISRNAAGEYASNNITTNREIGTIRHETGHAIDDFYGGQLEKTTLYGFHSNLSTDFKDENGKTMNDYLHNELQMHPYEVQFVGYNIKELKTGKDDRSALRAIGKNICSAYNEYMDSVLEQETGIKNAGNVLVELKKKHDELDNVVSAEMNEAIKETKEYREVQFIRNQLQIEEKRYAKEREDAGYYSITYNDDPVIQKLRTYKSELLNLQYAKESELRKEFRQKHPEIITQEEMETLDKLEDAKITLWKKTHGVDGIVGDVLDYMNVANTSRYSTRGHGNSYFMSRKGNGAVSEVFANLFDCYINKDSKKYNFVKKILPDTANMFEKIIKKFVLKER